MHSPWRYQRHKRRWKNGFRVTTWPCSTEERTRTGARHGERYVDPSVDRILSTRIVRTVHEPINELFYSTCPVLYVVVLQSRRGRLCDCFVVPLVCVAFAGLVSENGRMLVYALDATWCSFLGI